MSRETRVMISRIIIVTIFILSILAVVLGDFFITLITVCGGLFVWLLYLLAADLGTTQEQETRGTSLGKNVSKIIAGLGGILAVSAFMTYGMEQTMWGDFTFNLAGIALALAILVVMLLPLVILLLIAKPGVPPSAAKPTPSALEPAAPPPATAIPEQPFYYGTPYPYSPYYTPTEEEMEYDEEGEEWEEGEEGDDSEEYYIDEEGYEYDYEDEEESEDTEEDEE